MKAENEVKLAVSQEKSRICLNYRQVAAGLGGGRVAPQISTSLFHLIPIQTTSGFLSQRLPLYPFISSRCTPFNTQVWNRLHLNR